MAANQGVTRRSCDFGRRGAWQRVLALVAPLADGNRAAGRAAAGAACRNPPSRTRDQPPFAASAMDGYAVWRPGEPRRPFPRHRRWPAAGHAFAGAVGPRTGRAHLHRRAGAGRGDPGRHSGGCDRARATRSSIRADARDRHQHPRRRGRISARGDSPAAAPPAPRRPGASRRDEHRRRCTVTRRPVVAIIPQGTSWSCRARPRAPTRSSPRTVFALKAMAEAEGARGAPSAHRPRHRSRHWPPSSTLPEGADLIVTIGGASVGDHDLVGARR